MAATVPSTTSRVFWGVNVSIALHSGATGLASGTVYASVGTVKATWGYDIHREKVVGQNNPYLGTGWFHGEIDIEALGSSDNRWESIITVQSGIVAGYNVAWNEKDTQGTMSGRTWTVSGVKFTDRETLWAEDKVVKYKMRGYMPSEPTVS